MVAALKEAKVATDPEDYLDAHPSWRVSLLELCDPYGWHVVTLTEATTIQDRLSSFETMTWREILMSGDKKQNKYMSVDGLSNEAQARLDEIAPDIDELMSLRIGKQERVFGIMDGSVCQMVFWDPNHLIYKMNITDN